MTKLRCPEPVTTRPKPGISSSQKIERSAPLGVAAFWQNDGVSLARTATLLRNVTWPSGQHQVSTCQVYMRNREEAIGIEEVPINSHVVAGVSLRGRKEPVSGKPGFVSLNQRVQGSSPCAPTNQNRDLMKDG